MKYDRSSSVEEHQVGFAITEQIVEDYQLKVSISDVSECSLELLTLSYVIYIPEEVPLASYGGVINEQEL